MSSHVRILLDGDSNKLWVERNLQNPVRYNGGNPVSVDGPHDVQPVWYSSQRCSAVATVHFDPFLLPGWPCRNHIRRETGGAPMYRSPGCGRPPRRTSRHSSPPAGHSRGCSAPGLKGQPEAESTLSGGLSRRCNRHRDTHCGASSGTHFPRGCHPRAAAKHLMEFVLTASETR